MNRQEKIKRLQELQKSLELCTQPCDGHTDPKSNNDCWNWMRELLAEIQDEDEKLLLRAEQFQKEQLYLASGHEHHIHILTGVTRMVKFIKRHLGVADV